MNKQECPFLSDAGIDADSADNGIEICLNCTLPKCVYEVTTRSKRKREIRRAQVKVLSSGGKTVAEIVKLLEVSQATVYNDLRANKENENVKTR